MWESSAAGTALALVSMPIRVLVIEPDPESLLFLQDVMTELDGSSHWTHWTNLEAVYACDWAAAAVVLQARAAALLQAKENDGQTIDVTLADLDLPDSKPNQTFRRYQALAPDVPLILLAGENDRAQAQRLLREGAQDFLLKSELDCAPLAHAIRNAIERHRLLESTRSLSTSDPLTGLTTATRFLAALERERELARQHQSRMLLVVAEPCRQEEGTPLGSDDCDMALLRTAEVMQGFAGPLDLTGRIQAGRLGLALIETTQEPLHQRWDKIRSAARSQGLLLGAAFFDPKHPVSLDGLLKLAVADLEPQRSAATAG